MSVPYREEYNRVILGAEEETPCLYCHTISFKFCMETGVECRAFREYVLKGKIYKAHLSKDKRLPMCMTCSQRESCTFEKERSCERRLNVNYMQSMRKDV